MKKSARRGGNFVVPILLVTVVAVVGVLLHVLFSQSISNLTVEILAAIIAVVLVVASVAVTIHYQSRSETEHEYRVELFKQKVAVYRDLLECIARTDDDDHISDREIEDIRNRSRIAALYAHANLIGALADFIERLGRERVLYMPDTEGAPAGTLRAVVQAMRDDLAVVEGEDVTELIGRLVAKTGRGPQE